jgi:hypothetical protein
LHKGTKETHKTPHLRHSVSQQRSELGTSQREASLLGSVHADSVIIWMFNDALNGEAILYIVGWDRQTDLDSLNARVCKELLMVSFRLYSQDCETPLC